MASKLETLEKTIHETLKKTGLLFPISEKEIADFESKFTNLELPEHLKNPKQILRRNQEKISIAQQPILQVAALVDSKDSRIPNVEEESKDDSKKKKKK